MPENAPPTRPRKRSLVTLVADIPGQVRELVEREIDLVKTEVIAKLKSLGVGAGLLAGAVVVLLFMIGVLLTAAILGLSTVVPGWLAALIVAAVLLIIALILGLIGYRVLMRGVPPVPSESIDSIQRDLRAIKGIGKRGTP